MRNRDTIAIVDGLRKRCWSALVASALTVTPTASAWAGERLGTEPAGAWTALLVAPAGAEAAPAAVVGLETDSPKQGAALTKALRKAFAARGLSGGEEVNLSELRLALGCKGSSPKCLAKGGAVVRARRLIYGALRRDGGTWALDVTLVEVEGGAATSASLVITNAELAPDRIDRLADEVADRLAPDTAAATAPAVSDAGLASSGTNAPEPTDSDAAAGEEDQDGSSPRKLWWGWVEPQPRWKLAGFGLGVTFSVLGLGAVLGTGAWLSNKKGGFRGQLLDAAAASLTDSNPLNDVDPNLPGGVNLCEFAREHPDPSSPDRVRNASVAAVCNRGDAVKKAAIGSAVVTAVGLATTVTFTLLLFLHEKPARKSTWQRHGLQVGLDSATRGQGLSLRVAGRF